MEKPGERPATVDRIEAFYTRGPWETKSKGVLTVITALPYDVLRQYCEYNEEELKRIPEDIRGLRIYTVRNLPKSQIGGTEFHRVREEIVFGLDGLIKWECEDVFGEKKEFVLTPKYGLRMPPFILHSYEAVENGSGLIVIANTLFNPNNPKTHDTYTLEEFHNLQKQYA